MEQSILKSTKKILGVGDDDPSFDLDIITHINSAFSTLTDLGVGPEAGFVIEDDTAQWPSYLDGDPVKLSKIKTCVYLRVKLLFDPPTVAYLLDSTKQLLQENEWRLSVNREAGSWTDPTPPTPDVLEDLFYVDGGPAA
jgi:hypothetical protein